MSTLYERLLAAMPIAVVGLPFRASEVNRTREALRAVVELHSPRPCRCTDDSRHPICSGCPGHQPPERCPTIQAIAESLGVPTGDETT